MALNTNASDKTLIFGGSFDPIHLGHLHIARQALEMGAAREVWFIPSGKHRFKQDTILLDFDSRYNLVQKAIQIEPGFKVLDLDRAGLGDGSTYELMQKLKAAYPTHNFSYLIGMDNLAQLPSWYRFDWLKENVRFLIAARPGFTPDQLVISSLSQYSYLNCKPSDVSSSAVRRRLISGQGIQGLVPHQLLIEITRLYKNVLR